MTPHSRSLADRARVSVFALFLFLTAAGTVGYLSLSMLSKGTLQSLAVLQFETVNAGRLFASIVEEARTASAYLEHGDPAVQQDYWRLRSQSQALFVDLLRTTAETGEDALVLTNAQTSLSQAERLFALAHRRRDLNDAAGAHVMADSAAQHISQATADLAGAAVHRAGRLNEAGLALQTAVHRRTALLALLLLSAFVTMASALWLMNRALLRPLLQLRRHADALAAGDLDANTGVAGMPEEFRSLAQQMNSASASLARLAEAEAELRRSEKLSTIGMLVSGVAHELNNPLHAIQLGVDDLATHELEGDALSSLTILREHSQRASAIVRDLLTVVQPSTTPHTPVDIESILRTVMQRVRAHSSTRIWLGLEQPFAVAGDAAALERVFMNLVENAVHAAGPQGNVWIRAVGTDDTVSITVEDDGPGFGESAPHVFQPFFSKKRGATGLGLYVTRGIVEQHGGTIAAGPAIHAPGARLTVVLPTCDAASTPITAQPSAQPAGAVDAATSSSARILVVDDEAALRRLVQRALARAGYPVDTADDGLAAFEMICQAENLGDPYALIISDMRMPGVDGMALYRMLRDVDSPATGNFIVATGDQVAVEVAAFLAETRLQVIEKPFEMSALLAMVRTRVREASRNAQRGA